MSPRFLALCAVLLTPLATLAVEAPAPPKQYDVQIRYDIVAARNDRISQYNELLKSLKLAGFVLDESKVEETDPEDVNATRLYGTIAGDKARQLLAVRNVRTVLLTPKDAKPEDKAAPVRVQLELTPMPSVERQRQLAEQMRQVLLGLNFKEAVAYDNRGYTRIVGSLPAGQVETLFTDVRLVPTGWALLSKTLLADLRKYPGGADLLETVLTEWVKTPAGKKVVDTAVEDWRIEPAAKKYAASLPLNPAEKIDAAVLQEQLMVQMAHHPDAREALQTLLAHVLRNEKAPELMDILLRRLNASPANVDLPLLYRTTAPLRLIEVLPGVPLPAGRPAAPPVPPGQERIDPELRDLLKDAAKADQPLRFEVLLARTPEPGERGWLSMIRDVSDVSIEGRLGSLVTVFGTLSDVLKLAARDEIVGVRLPRLGRSHYQTLKTDDKPPSALLTPGLVQLYDKGHRGKGTRVAVIDTDFRGWEKAVAEGNLPPKTRLLDLTRERNRTLEPDPYTGPPVEVGIGLRNAMNTAKATPEAEMILIRIDAAAPYMLQSIAAAITGDDYRSIALEQRQKDLDVDRQLLRDRGEALRREFQDILDNSSEDFLKDATSIKARAAYNARKKQYEVEQRAYEQRIRILLQYRQDLDALKGVRVVSSALIWNDGHPVEGGSALSRFFDDRPFKTALWFQAAGDARGQAWTDLFRDADGNGVMEFAPADRALPQGSWTNELNFLAWQSAKDGSSLDLPANAKVRLSVQWREAHDAAFADAGKDVYRDPLANLKLSVLYQPDPEGKQEPADDLVLQFESSGTPLRLQAAANAATYEQTLTFTVPKAGRYAVRIEGRIPDGTRPAQYPTIPAAKKSFELRPRLFVETLDGPGQAVLHSYSTEAGSIGTPGDAHNVIPVGAAP